MFLFCEAKAPNNSKAFAQKRKRTKQEKNNNSHASGKKMKRTKKVGKVLSNSFVEFHKKNK